MNKVTPEQKKAMREQLLKEARKERRHKHEYERFWNDSSRTCEKMGYRLEECMMIGPKTLKEHLSENLGIDWMELGIEDKRNLGVYFWQQAREGKNDKDANLYPVPITFLTPDGKGNMIPEEENYKSYTRRGTEKISNWQNHQIVELNFFEKILQYLGLYCTTRLEYNKMLSDSREAVRKKAEALKHVWDPVREQRNKYMKDFEEKHADSLEVVRAIDDKYKEWEKAFFGDGKVPKTVTLPNGKKLDPVAGCMALLAKMYTTDFKYSLYRKSPDLGYKGKEIGNLFKKYSIGIGEDIRRNPESILPNKKEIDGWTDFTVEEAEDLKESGFIIWMKKYLSSAFGKEVFSYEITEQEKNARKRLDDIYGEMKPYNAVKNWQFEEAKRLGGPEIKTPVIDKSNDMDTEKNKQNEEPEKEEEMTVNL